MNWVSYLYLLQSYIRIAKVNITTSYSRLHVAMPLVLCLLNTHIYPPPGWANPMIASFGNVHLDIYCLCSLQYTTYKLGSMYDHSRINKVFTLVIKRMLIWTYRMATTLNWICMSSILKEVGAKHKVTFKKHVQLNVVERSHHTHDIIEQCAFIHVGLRL